jgi:NADH:ubiquinone oxidoreductase subunit K
MALRLIFILSSAGGASFSLSYLMLVAGECIIGLSFIVVWFQLLVCLDLLPLLPS